MSGERERIEELIEASSLGTPDAVAMRVRTSPEVARRIVARAKELASVYVVVGRIRQPGGRFRERVHATEPTSLDVAREQAVHLRAVAVRGGRTLDTYRVCELMEVPDDVS